MAFSTSVTINLDAVSDETIANATGNVLFQLGQNLFDELCRLRRHRQRAQAALDDAHNVPRRVQQALGAEVAAAKERMERLAPLFLKAAAKLEAEAVAHFGLHRRRPAIDLMSCDEWDIISNAASVFAVDYPSTIETDSESHAGGTDGINTSFDCLGFDDEDNDAATINAGSSTDEDRPAAAATRRRPVTPHAAPQSSARAQPHEFGPPSESSPRARVQPSRTTLSVQQRWEQPAPTPYSAVPPAPSSSAAAATGRTTTSSARPPAVVHRAQPAAVFSNGRGTSAQATAPSSRAPSSSSASSATPAQPHASSVRPPHSTAAELAAEATYDAIVYDGHIYGYVGGSPVFVVPDLLRNMSVDELEDISLEVSRRRREAEAELKEAKKVLENTASADGPHNYRPMPAGGTGNRADEKSSSSTQQPKNEKKFGVIGGLLADYFASQEHKERPTLSAKLVKTEPVSDDDIAKRGKNGPRVGTQRKRRLGQHASTSASARMVEVVTLSDDKDEIPRPPAKKPKKLEKETVVYVLSSDSEDHLDP